MAYSRIRYGNEVDIFYAINQSRDGIVMPARELGSTILSFSASVQDVPKMPAFDTVVENLGFTFVQLPDLADNDRLLVPPVVNALHVANPENISGQQIKALAEGLIRLSDEYGQYNDGILFYDHTVIPQGDLIARA